MELVHRFGKRCPIALFVAHPERPYRSCILKFPVLPKKVHISLRFRVIGDFVFHTGKNMQGLRLTPQKIADFFQILARNSLFGNTDSRGPYICKDPLYAVLTRV